MHRRQINLYIVMKPLNVDSVCTSYWNVTSFLSWLNLRYINRSLLNIEMHPLTSSPPPVKKEGLFDTAWT